MLTACLQERAGIWLILPQLSEHRMCPAPPADQLQNREIRRTVHGETASVPIDFFEGEEWRLIGCSEDGLGDEVPTGVGAAGWFIGS